MDLLANRYANPFLILDNVIRLGQLHDFSIQILKIITEEKVQERRWEIYLHKVWNMTFEDYVNSCESKPENHEMTEDEIKNVIEQSTNILEGFAL